MRGVIGIVLAVIVAACGEKLAAQAPPPVANLHGQVAGLFARMDAGERASIVVLGDSIPWKPEQTEALRELVSGAAGSATDGGVGYRALNQSFALGPYGVDRGVKLAYKGLAENIIKANTTGNRTAVGRFLNGGYSQLRLDGTATATLPAGSSGVLYYRVFPGAGILKIRPLTAGGVQAGPDVLIDTNGVEAIGKVVLPPLVGGATKIALSSTSGLWVQVDGIDIETSAPGGVTLHNLARGNNGPKNYNLWQQSPGTAGALADLHPDLVIIETDWYAPGQTKATFVADLVQQVGFVRAAVPGVGVVIVAHHAMQADDPEVSELCWAAAEDLGAGFIDLRQVCGWDPVYTVDGVHLSEAGGAFYSGVIWADLSAAR